MRLLISHTHPRLGAAILRRMSEQERAALPCPQDHVLPIRYRYDQAHAARLIERWNRRFSTQET